MKREITSNASLEETLNYFVHLNNFQKEPLVVNVGCGKFFGFEILTELYGQNVFGIDVDTHDINNLKKAYPKNNYQFIVGNAEYLQTYIKEPIDLVIARHPNVYKDPWESIFTECNEAQSEKGKLITTCYYDEEAELVLKNLQNANYNVWFCDENISRGKFNMSQKELELLNVTSEDKYVIVASKY